MTLQDLIKTPDTQRDPSWENQFFHALSEARLKILSQDPQTGPDGWPYLLVETSEEGTEPAQKIIQWLATRGIGLVINPMKEYPDYVFSYGMMWSFKETGFFFKNAPEVKNGQFDLQNIAHAGTPTPQYLPDYVRQILKQFFLDQGVLQPKILLVSQDRVHYDLAFSVESLGNPPESEWEGIAEAIGWFLPPHYSLLLVSEKEMPEFSNL